MSIEVVQEPVLKSFQDIDELAGWLRSEPVHRSSPIPISEMTLQEDGTLRTPNEDFALSNTAFRDVAVLAGLGKRVANKYLGESLDEIILYAVKKRFRYIGEKARRILYYRRENQIPLAISLSPASYMPISHGEVISAALENIPEDTEFHRADVTLDTLKVNFMDKGSNVGVSKDDRIIHGICLVNTYQGRRCIVTGSLERLVCTNGLTVSEKVCGRTILHNNHGKVVGLNGNLSQAIVKAGTILSRLVPRIKHFQNTKLNTEFYVEVMNQLRSVPGLKKKDVEEILEPYAPGAEPQRDLYDLFNLVTQMGRDAREVGFYQHMALERVGGWFLTFSFE